MFDISGRRNRKIDLIRGLSILVVLFHHFNIAYRLDDTSLSRVFGWSAVRAVARNGNYGVTMFFVVSGFLITSNARRRWGALGQIDARHFYVLRAARILPCLLLLLAVVNLLSYAGIGIFQNHPEAGGPVSFWVVNFASLTFWMNVLMARAGWLNYALCVLWSLSVEEVFYLSLPLACLALRREALLAAFWAVFVVVGPLWRMTHQDSEAGALYAYLACFDGIAIGCIAALLASRVAPSRSLQLAVIGGMAFLYLIRSIGDTNVYGVTLMALGTAILLLGAHQRPSTPLLDRSWSVVLGWFGRLSYELYLFHLIVLGSLRTIFLPSAARGDQKLLLLLAYVALSAGTAALIGRFYSEPSNRGIRLRAFAARAPATA